MPPFKFDCCVHHHPLRRHRHRSRRQAAADGTQLPRQTLFTIQLFTVHIPYIIVYNILFTIQLITVVLDLSITILVHGRFAYVGIPGFTCVGIPYTQTDTKLTPDRHQFNLFYY